MDYRFLKHQYYETRNHQLALHGQSFTTTAKAASDVIFDSAIEAITNVDSGRRSKCMQAVSLSTGVGKSTSAYALIATFAKHVPSFSAAYVVPTIRMAIEAQAGIEALLGENTTTLWSCFHKHKGVDSKKAYEDLGFIPNRLVNKDDLTSSRIIIVTHGQLKHEAQTKRDEGCVHYLGRPRSVVFIDEHPDLVQIVSAVPRQVQSFHDDLVKLKADHPWLPVLTRVVQRMSSVAQSSNERQSYSLTEILSDDETKVFDDEHGLSLWEMTDEELSDDLRFGQLQRMRTLVTFLRAASKGNVFYSRYDWTFFAYELHFDSHYSGFVLLDATSDLTGLVSLHPKVKTTEVPKVSYENLGLFHIELPHQFKRIRDVIKNAGVGREYGKFIVQSILANAPEGADVLVVVHKDVLTQELIATSDDPALPLDWGGRRVNTQNWGAGVGLNTFRHKTHVFLFGDFYMPRAATIAQTHGWSQQPLDSQTLGLATGRRKAGDVFVPQGEYRKIHEGQLLRWTKQLAMRGTARQVDESGRCFPMHLFTTMDLCHLLPNLDRLFPMARPPIPANPPDDTFGVSMNGRRGLMNLLMATVSRPMLGADEVEAVTGIHPSKLAREFKAIEEDISLLGWTLKSAGDLGFAGRMKYLVNESRLPHTCLKAS